MKEYLIRTLAVKMMVSEKTIEAVINHQFNSANEAMKFHNTVEISGFGKFTFNYKKAVKKMEKMLAQRQHLLNQLDTPIDGRKREVVIIKIEGLTAAIEILKPKIDENKFLTDVRGMEEQADSSI
jgi:nucleoid DNA-binding protein